MVLHAVLYPEPRTVTDTYTHLLFHKYTEIKAIKHKLPNLFFLYQNIHLVILFGSPCLRRSFPLPRLIPTIVFFDVMILTPYGFCFCINTLFH